MSDGLKILLGALGGAVSEVGGDALVAGSPKLGWGPVASKEDKLTFAVQIKARSKAGIKTKVPPLDE